MVQLEEVEDQELDQAQPGPIQDSAYDSADFEDTGTKALPTLENACHIFKAVEKSLARVADTEFLVQSQNYQKTMKYK